jgi:hypothetical protein
MLDGQREDSKLNLFLELEILVAIGILRNLGACLPIHTVSYHSILDFLSMPLSGPQISHFLNLFCF